MAWGKFYWNDWAADPKLRLCSAASQGLWMRMLCICAEADGYLTIADRPLTSKDIAAITGWPEHDVLGWMDELERWGVYSIDGKARIYSRRMVADVKKARTARKNGKNGGNPSLGNKRGSGSSVNQQVKATVKGGDKPQKPEARNQNQKEEELKTPTSEEIEAQQNGQAVRRGTRLPVGWEGDGEAVIHAIREGFSDTEAFTMLDDFRDFWAAKAGVDGCKLDWLATWRRWVREEGRRRVRGRSATGPPKRVSWV